jgi:hypothetical protein
VLIFHLAALTVKMEVEHLIEGEVLRCAASFFRFHDLCTSEDRDAYLLVCMGELPYDMDLLSCRPQWKICKEVLYPSIWVHA